jgi:hypothetical protein
MRIIFFDMLLDRYKNNDIASIQAILVVGGCIMSFCNHCEECFFFCDPLIDSLTENAENLRGKYCEGDSAKCAIYKLANYSDIHNVPGYVNPNDDFQQKGLQLKCRNPLIFMAR